MGNTLSSKLKSGDEPDGSIELISHPSLSVRAAQSSTYGWSDSATEHVSPKLVRQPSQETDVQHSVQCTASSVTLEDSVPVQDPVRSLAEILPSLPSQDVGHIPSLSADQAATIAAAHPALPLCDRAGDRSVLVTQPAPSQTDASSSTAACSAEHSASQHEPVASTSALADAPESLSRHKESDNEHTAGCTAVGAPGEEAMQIPCQSPDPDTGQRRLEAQYYAGFINAECQGSEPSPAMVPLHLSGATLATACQSGVLLCKLLSYCQPDCLDERVVNLPETEDAELPEAERLQNVQLCLNAAGALGANISHIDAGSIAEGQEEAVLECLWQIVRLRKLQDVNLKHFPALLALQGPEEELPALLEVAPEQLLTRWLSHRLAEPLSHWRHGPVENLGRDLRNCEAYVCLLQQLRPACIDSAALLRETDVDVRARAVHAAIRELTGGAAALPPAEALLGDNERLHCIFLSELFHTFPALQVTPAELAEQRAALAWLEPGDIEASREERTFRTWLNSLLPGAHVSSLYGEALRDGWFLLQAIARIRPGAVDFSRAHAPPFRNPLHKRPKSLENCNLVVSLTKDLLHLPLINVGGLDILNGQKKIILAILYQLMRLHTHALLQRVRPTLNCQPSTADAHACGPQSQPSSQDAAAGPAAHAAISNSGHAPDSDHVDSAQMDAEILAWANQTVESMGSPHLRIATFADPSLASGRFLITLLAAVDPGSVKPGLVTSGVSPEDKALNAKYAISLARKLGCSIFMVWEDIVEVNPKMIAIFVASLMVHAARAPAAQE